MYLHTFKVIHLVARLLWSIVMHSYQCHFNFFFFACFLICRFFPSHFDLLCHYLPTFPFSALPMLLAPFPSLSFFPLISCRWRCLANIVISFTAHFTCSTTQTLFIVLNQQSNWHIRDFFRGIRKKGKIIGRLCTTQDG